MAKVSAVNKNDKELNFLIDFIKKDKVLKKLLWIKNYH